MSACMALKSGCSAERTHSKATISTLTITAPGGGWVRVFTLPPPSGLTFVGQMYGYDLNATFPYDYIVSNPVTFTF